MSRRMKDVARACMPLDQWPSIDRALWQAAIAPADPFDEFGGSRANHRLLSNRNVVRGHGRWLTWLKLSGAWIQDQHSADAITPETTLAYVRELDRCGNTKGTILARLEELREMAKILDPTRDWSCIGGIVAKVRARTNPISTEPPLRLSSADLVDLGFELMARATHRKLSVRTAILYRDGLLIAFLALRPLRRRNLTELALGTDLLTSASGWDIAIPRAASKTHVPIESDWPPLLHDAMVRYLSEYRPLLVGRSGRWHRDAGGSLWVSGDGSPLTQDAIYQQVISRTHAKFGRRISPHKFRHITVTTIAIYDPKHVRSGAPLLSHVSFQTTQKYYIQARSLEAHRNFASHLFAIRNGDKHAHRKK